MNEAQTSVNDIEYEIRDLIKCVESSATSHAHAGVVNLLDTMSVFTWTVNRNGEIFEYKIKPEERKWIVKQYQEKDQLRMNLVRLSKIWVCRKD